MAPKAFTEEPTDEELGAGVTEPVAEHEDALPEPPKEEVKLEPEAASPATPVEKPAEEPKLVDLRALQEARNEAREAKQHAAVLEQRWNDFLAVQNKPAKEEATAIPKWSEDPIAAGQWTQEQVLAEQQHRQEEQREYQQRQQAYDESQRLLADASAEYTELQKVDPSVKDAYEALLGSFRKEASFYPNMTQGQREQFMAKTEFEHIAYARRAQIPLADYIKGLASARGWQPSGAAAQQSAPPVVKLDLAATAAAQQRHQSLSDAPGGGAPVPIDAKALANMSEKEFKAWMSNRANEKKFNEIMGG